MAAGDPAWTPPYGHPDDIVNIQYTSGTTGSPKGVLLTHRNILNNGLMIAHALHATVDDRLCVPVPMYHCFGCVIGAMVSVSTGAAMILPSAQFDARAALEAVERERATAARIAVMTLSGSITLRRNCSLSSGLRLVSPGPRSAIIAPPREENDMRNRRSLRLRRS